MYIAREIDPLGQPRHKRFAASAPPAGAACAPGAPKANKGVRPVMTHTPAPNWPNAHGCAGHPRALVSFHWSVPAHVPQRVLRQSPTYLRRTIESLPQANSRASLEARATDLVALVAPSGPAASAKTRLSPARQSAAASAVPAYSCQRPGRYASGTGPRFSRASGQRSRFQPAHPQRGPSPPRLCAQGADRLGTTPRRCR